MITRSAPRTDDKVLRERIAKLETRVEQLSLLAELLLTRVSELQDKIQFLRERDGV